jgi:CHASE2 domain-containing sensor protein
VYRKIWNRFKATVSFWQIWALPGAAVMGLVVAARLTGSLQGLEWFALDTYLRLRPPEPEDDRIVLVGLDTADLEKIGYPIPETALVNLLNTLQTYRPAVIGLHIYQSQMARSGNSDLFAALNRPRNVVVMEKVLPASDQIPPPLGFPESQVGFADIVPDSDNHLRRAMLGSLDPINSQVYKRSFAIRLVEAYLGSRNPALTLLNGIQDPDAMRFGSTEIPRLFPSSGGYVGAETGGPQTLLNFRVGAHPFRMLSLSQIQTKQFDPGWLRDRIVLVGITDPTIRPNIETAATSPTNSLQIQAHVISQIISAVQNHRLLLNTWTDPWEYLWIAAWGCLAILIGHSTLAPRTKLLILALMQVGLLITGYLLLLCLGWWIPIVPATLVWLLTGIGYTAFYKYDWVLRSRLRENQRLIEERQRTIEQTFNVIHNGPLQTLASLLRRMRDATLSQSQILTILEGLNAELRGLGDHLKQEILTQEESLYLRGGLKLNLNVPLHELFYEVYCNTLEHSDLAQFRTLKVACHFDPIEPLTLPNAQRRELCRFLEEALCNIGKHAEGATQMGVSGALKNGWYSLRVTDDGPGLQSLVEGEGTKYARKLALQLKGRFKRESLSPKGTLCELKFPLGMRIK